MEQWQKNLIEEYIELRLKETKLRLWLRDNGDGEELLYLQDSIMISYLDVLKLRGKEYKIDLEDEFNKTMRNR